MAPLPGQLIAQLIDTRNELSEAIQATDRPAGHLQTTTTSNATGWPGVGPRQQPQADQSNVVVQLSGHLLLLFALLVLINLIVILGNILVIVAVHATVKLRSVTNIFIVSLATADLLLGLFVLPYALLYEVLDVWIFGRVWCRGWLVTDVWISTASILNLCAISIDRYVAVTRPVKYRSIMTARRAKSIVAAVWMVSFLICFPPLLPLKWAPSSGPSEAATTAPIIAAAATGPPPQPPYAFPSIAGQKTFNESNVHEDQLRKKRQVSGVEHAARSSTVDKQSNQVLSPLEWPPPSTAINLIKPNDEPRPPMRDQQKGCLKRVNCLARDYNHSARGMGPRLNKDQPDDNKRDNISDVVGSPPPPTKTTPIAKTFSSSQFALSSSLNASRRSSWSPSAAKQVVVLLVLRPRRAGRVPKRARPSRSSSVLASGERTSSLGDYANSFTVNNNNWGQFMANKTTFTFTFIVTSPPPPPTTTTKTTISKKTTIKTPDKVLKLKEGQSNMKQGPPRRTSSADRAASGSGGPTRLSRPLADHSPPSSRLKAASATSSSWLRPPTKAGQSLILNHFASQAPLGRPDIDEKSRRRRRRRQKMTRPTTAAHKVADRNLFAWPAQMDSIEWLDCFEGPHEEPPRAGQPAAAADCCGVKKVAQILRFSTRTTSRLSIHDKLAANWPPTSQGELRLVCDSVKSFLGCQAKSGSQSPRQADKYNHLKGQLKLIIICGHDMRPSETFNQEKKEEADNQRQGRGQVPLEPVGDVTLNKAEQLSPMNDNIAGRFNEFIVEPGAGSKRDGRKTSKAHINELDNFIVIICAEKDTTRNNKSQKEEQNYPPNREADKTTAKDHKGNEICLLPCKANLDACVVVVSFVWWPSSMLALPRGQRRSLDRPTPINGRLCPSWSWSSSSASSWLSLADVCRTHVSHYYYESAAIVLVCGGAGANESSSATNDHPQTPIGSAREGQSRLFGGNAAGSRDKTTTMTTSTSSTPNLSNFLKHLSRFRRQSQDNEPSKEATEANRDNLNINQNNNKSQTTTNNTMECTLFHDKTYVIYSALGSFYIPMLFMVFFYSRIYLVASRAQKAMQRGYVTTKSWPSVQNNNNNKNNDEGKSNNFVSNLNWTSNSASRDKAKGVGRADGPKSNGPSWTNGGDQSGRWRGNRSARPERVTLRIHRRSDQQHQTARSRLQKMSTESAASATIETNMNPSIPDNQVWPLSGCKSDEPKSNSNGNGSTNCLGTDSILMKLTANEQQKSLANANSKITKPTITTTVNDIQAEQFAAESFDKIDKDDEHDNKKHDVVATADQKTPGEIETVVEISQVLNREHGKIDYERVHNYDQYRGRHHHHHHHHHRRHNHHHHHQHRNHHHNHHHDHHRCQHDLNQLNCRRKHHHHHHHHHHHRHHHRYQEHNKQHEDHKHDHEKEKLHCKCHHRTQRGGRGSNSNRPDTSENGQLECATSIAGIHTAKQDDSKSSVQITISRYEDERKEEEEEGAQSGCLSRQPLLASSQADSLTTAKNERSQSDGLLGGDHNNCSGQLAVTKTDNNEDHDVREGDLGRPNRSHSYGPMPTIMVNWGPDSGKYDSRLAATNEMELARGQGISQVGGARSASAMGACPRRPSSFGGGGLSLMVNLPHQMRKQSIMLLNSLTSKSSQTLRRLSTAATHPVDVFFKTSRPSDSRDESSSSNEDAADDADDHDNSCGQGVSIAVDKNGRLMHKTNRKKQQREREKKSRLRGRKKHQLSGGGQTKKTLDDFLMAVAGIDTSSGEESARDNEISDIDQEEEDEDDFSDDNAISNDDDDYDDDDDDDDDDNVGLSGMLRRENLLMPSTTISSGEDNDSSENKMRTDRRGQEAADVGQRHRGDSYEKLARTGHDHDNHNDDKNNNDELDRSELAGNATGEVRATNQHSDNKAGLSRSNLDETMANVDESAALLKATDLTTSAGGNNANKGQQHSTARLVRPPASSAIWRPSKPSPSGSDGINSNQAAPLLPKRDPMSAVNEPVGKLAPSASLLPKEARFKGGVPGCESSLSSGAATGKPTPGTPPSCGPTASSTGTVSSAQFLPTPCVPAIKTTVADDKPVVAGDSSGGVGADLKNFKDAINQATSTTTTSSAGRTVIGTRGGPGSGNALSAGPSGQPRRRLGTKRTSRWHAKRLRAETKAAKTVAIIVGGFIFCWLPFFTAYLSRAIICESPSCIPQSWLSLFIWLGYLNSAINPVIYGLFSADFRHAFKNIVCRCRLRATHDDTAVVSVLVDSIIKSIL